MEPKAQLHDLSALDGLLGDIDIQEQPSQDRREAKLEALFQEAKRTYVAKVDSEAWYLDSDPSAVATQLIEEPRHRFDPATFYVPSPTELLRQRKDEKTGTTHQEWTSAYLYSLGHFGLCASYVASFAQSMTIPILISDDANDANGRDSTQHYAPQAQKPLRRTKQERDLSRNWGVIKDIVDTGLRSISQLLSAAGVLSDSHVHKSTAELARTTTIDAWVSRPASKQSTSTSDAPDEAHTWGKLDLWSFGTSLIRFSDREIRIGSGDSTNGYTGMISTSSPKSDSSTLERQVNQDRVMQNNWTVSYGLALTSGDLALQLGLYRSAIDSYTLFLGARGLMWRVLLAMANALCGYADEVAKESRSPSSEDGQDHEKQRQIAALHTLTKAMLVSAIQTCPRARRNQVASVALSGTLVPSSLLCSSAAGVEGERTSSPIEFKDEDDLLFNGLLPLPAPHQRQSQVDSVEPVLAEEIAVCLTKVVFAKKLGVMGYANKFTQYIQEYSTRLENADPDNYQDDQDDEDQDQNTAMRSVRTL
ncbi:hypothetical protein BCV70DRAFT_199828 [Testicularia cyperi]|uniref:Uncharacterized protein n=1 Tax=Testicularia cyperi TaxID=1882483 RepID=A0A317XQH0_9BASI|nr:hypothetical protein BCV70DRAFT_199828 [Testicularia cyperi]